MPKWVAPNTKEWISGNRWCQAERCCEFTTWGSKYCVKHGGEPSKTVVTLAGLPLFYSHRLGKTLAAVLKETTGVQPEEQLQCFEELAIIRETALPTLMTWEKLHAAYLADPTNEKLRIADEMYGMQSRQLMKEVIDSAMKVERIVNGGKDKFNITGLLILRNQIVRVMYEVCERHGAHGIAEEFEQHIEQYVKMPVDGTIGTALTPDQDVIDMDDSIPKEEPDQEAA